MKFSPGCKCCVVNCNGTGNVCATVAPSCTGSGGTYSSFGYSGLTVTLKDTATPPNAIGTGTTNASGVACISYPSAIPMTVSVSGDCGSASANVTGDCATDDVTLTLPGINWSVTYTQECGLGFNGATFTISGPGTSYTITFPASGTPSTVTISLCGPVFGTYTVTLADSPCANGRTDNITVNACTGSSSFTVTSKLFSITGVISNQCSSAGGGGYNPLPGATVSVTGAAGTGSATTAADGSYTVSGLKAGCAYSISASKNCYVTATGSGTVGCGTNTWSPIMAPDFTTNFCTNPCCVNPTQTITITDAQGTHTLTPNTTHTTFGSAYIVKSGMTCTCYNFGTCSGTFTSTILYFYSLVCNSDGTWTCTRSVSTCSGLDLGAANLSGGSPVPVADGATCASPGDVATTVSFFGENITKPAITCGPISLSFSFTKGFSDTATVSDSSTCG